MATINEIRIRLNELAEHYSGPAFAGLITAERGYHLVRAYDQMVEDGWFGYSRPVINYHAKGPDEIFIEVKEFSSLYYTVTMKKGTSNNGQSSDLHYT